MIYLIILLIFWVMCCELGCLHEEDSFLHVLGQPSHPGLLVERLAVVDDVEVTVQAAQVSLSVMMQV